MVARREQDLVANPIGLTFSKPLGFDQALAAFKSIDCAINKYKDSCLRSLPGSEENFFATSTLVAKVGDDERDNFYFIAADVCSRHDGHLPRITTNALAEELMEVMRSSNFGYVYADMFNSTDELGNPKNTFANGDRIPPWIRRKYDDGFGLPIVFHINPVRELEMVFGLPTDKLQRAALICQYRNSPTARKVAQDKCQSRADALQSRMTREVQALALLVASFPSVDISAPFTLDNAPNTLSMTTADVLSAWSSHLQCAPLNSTSLSRHKRFLNIILSTSALTIAVSNSVQLSDLHDRFAQEEVKTATMDRVLSTLMVDVDVIRLSLQQLISEVDRVASTLNARFNDIARELFLLDLHTYANEIITELSLWRQELSTLLIGAANNFLPPGILGEDDYRIMAQRAMKEFRKPLSDNFQDFRFGVVRFQDGIRLLIKSILAEDNIFSVFSMIPMPIHKHGHSFLPQLEISIAAINPRTKQYIALDRLPTCGANKRCHVESPLSSFSPSVPCGVDSILPSVSSSPCIFYPTNVTAKVLRAAEGLIYAVPPTTTASFLCARDAHETIINLNSTGIIPTKPGCSYTISLPNGQTLIFHSPLLIRDVQTLPERSIFFSIEKSADFTTRSNLFEASTLSLLRLNKSAIPEFIATSSLVATTYRPSLIILLTFASLTTLIVFILWFLCVNTSCERYRRFRQAHLRRPPLQIHQQQELKPLHAHAEWHPSDYDPPPPVSLPPSPRSAHRDVTLTNPV